MESPRTAPLSSMGASRASRPGQLSRSLAWTDLGPSPAPSPESPSLSLHPACPPALPRAGQWSRAASREREERPWSSSPSSSATAAALTLETELAVPAYDGDLALCVGDVLGRSWYYALER